MQVNATIGPDNQLSFQAGHAGSIPVTRSKSLTSTNADCRHETLKSGTSPSGSDRLFAERGRGRAPRTGWPVLGRLSTVHDVVGLDRLRGSHAPERAAFLAAASSRGSTDRLARASSA